VRIIAGKAKGLKLKSINIKQTRPTKDRVKEAIFNIIAPFIPDSKVLDLFAGFGNLGLEAISRGAQKVSFVEKNNRVARVINENIKLCQFESDTEVFTQDVLTYLTRANEIYDLVFMDPPYNKGWIDKVIKKLIKSELLYHDSLIIAEHEKNINIQDSKNINIIRERNYGETSITNFQLGED